MKIVCKSITLIIIGVLLIAAGITTYFIIKSATKQAILDEFVIDSVDHKNYQGFLDDSESDDQKTFYDWHVWNLTNPSNFSNGAELPNFVETGPYSYHQRIDPRNVTFSEDGNSISYLEHTRYVPQPGRTTSSTETIVNVNPFYLGIVAAASGSETALGLSFAAGALAAFTDATVWGTTVTQTSTGVASFPAYVASLGGSVVLTTAESTILTTLQSTTSLVTYVTLLSRLAAGVDVSAQILALWPNGPSFTTPVTVGTTTTTKAALVVQYAQTVASGVRSNLISVGGANGGLLYRNLTGNSHIFGPDPLLFATTRRAAGYYTNHTGDTVGNRFTISNGKNDESEMGLDHFTEVDGVTTSTAYQNAAGVGPTVVVNGRTQSMAAFQDDIPDTISVYALEVQRYVPFTRTIDVEVDGIEAIRYVAQVESLLQVGEDYNITTKGFNPVGFFANGLPLYLSAPHQQFTDSTFSSAVTGQNYDPTQHDTFLALEKTTGLPVQARLALQMNVLLNTTATTYQDIPNPMVAQTMIPQWWLDKNYVISEDGADTLRRAVVTAVIARRAVLGSCVGVGSVLIIIAIILLVLNNKEDSNDSAAAAKNQPEEVTNASVASDNQEVEVVVSTTADPYAGANAAEEESA